MTDEIVTLDMLVYGGLAVLLVLGVLLYVVREDW